MKGVDLEKAREILESLEGKRPPIGEISRKFMDDGAYTNGFADDLINEVTRKIVHTVNKAARAEGRFDDQFFNFVRMEDTKDGGVKVQYYERFDNATALELAQLANVEYRKWNAQGVKFFEIHDRANGKYRREYTRLLDFDWREMRRPTD